MKLTLLLFLFHLAVVARSNKIVVTNNASLYALANELKSDTTVIIDEGEYSLTTSHVLSFHGLHNVAIVGAGRGITLIKCDFGSGLDFSNITELTLANLSLVGCGKLMESTSINITSNKPAIFKAALYFLDCTNVIIDNLEVSNSTGTGIAMYDVTGKVWITNSLLQYNKPKEEEQLPSGGGMSIEFTYCLKPGESVGTPCTMTYTTNTVYTVRNCSFHGNTASSLDVVKTAYIVPHANNHQQFGRGGGMSVFFRGQAINNDINVLDCNFTNNQAVWGGGLHFDILDQSKGNQINIQNSNFNNNHCPYQVTLYSIGTGGGGIRIALLPQHGSDYQCHINLTNCTFVNNSAYYGGGISVQLLREDTLSATSTMKLSNCIWQNNMAKAGSAVDITTNWFPLGNVPVVYLDSCTFIGNTNQYTQKSIREVGVGALYSKSVPVMFQNNISFLENYGSAIAGVAVEFAFNTGTIAIFEGNTGNNGGAIALLGQAFIVVYPKTTFMFVENKADVSGGAIYSLSASNRETVNSGSCFVYYHNISIGPYDWDTNFTFEANYAPKGRSIYCTNLFPCVWGGLPGGTMASKEVVSQVLYWNGTFSYRGVVELDKEIETDPSYITNYRGVSNDGMLHIPPGRFYKFNIDWVDNKGEKIRTAYIVQTNNKMNCSVSEISSYSALGIVQLKGTPGSVLVLTFQSVSTQPLVITFNVTLDQCPPGYYLSHDSLPNATVCICSATQEEKYQYRGIDKCNDFELVSYLKPRFWAGYVNNGGLFATADCPKGYCFTNQTSLLKLPSNALSNSSDALMCKPQHRTGTLCGLCEKHHCVYRNMNQFKCGKYHFWHIAIHAARYVFVVALLTPIVLYNINLVDGLWSGCIYYSQILFTMHVDATDEVTAAIYHFIYGIFNLDFIEQLVPACISPTFRSALLILVFEYILFGVALFATISLIIYHAYKGEATRGISNAIITLFVLFFVKITTVSLLILNPVTLTGQGGYASTDRTTVVWVDGTKSYFKGGHLAYAIPATLLLALFLLPMGILIYYIKKLLYLQCKQNAVRTSQNTAFVDTTSLRRRCALSLEAYKKHFGDALEDPYKNKYEIFSGLHFLYRLMAICIYCFVMSFALQYLLQFLLHLATLIIQVTFHPFKKRMHNISNVIVFSCLIIISGINLYQYHVDSEQLNPDKLFYYVQFVVIMVPSMIMIYAIYESGVICHVSKKLKYCYNKYYKKYHNLEDGSTNRTKQNDPEYDKTCVPLSIWVALSFLCFGVIVLFIFVALVDVFCTKCQIVAKLLG